MTKRRIRMVTVDMDGTLVGPDGQVSARNLAAMHAAERAGVEIVIATGRRHSYAMKVLRGLGLNEENGLITSNGAVIRTVGAELLGRSLLRRETGEWLCRQIGEFRRALLVTFDRVMADGDDTHGALVVEGAEELQGSIGKWMTANARYIEKVVPIEESLGREGMIQMMLCGTIERMREAEALLLTDPKVLGVGLAPLRRAEVRREGVEAPAVLPEAALHRTEYPERDLCIVDILPAGCSKGTAVMELAGRRGLKAEEILAIGDNWNDVSMLDAAGSAVLMGNAPPDLKEIAAGRGWVVGSRHDADGVAEVIEAALDDALEMPVMARSGKSD
ncbi:MAG: HAD family hydrolase [Edaphobacter sp.]|uniref:HAD-IIB family hydrolase n=1 Tax=Edaphobacter sp. TaxID=1934404 RepID=UPI00239AA888|nr:HAD family hydrolase [Edaphobacter sp.]MDE1177897.1 HAD family hydrolase [Edaphobacter sp.]